MKPITSMMPKLAASTLLIVLSMTSYAQTIKLGNLVTFSYEESEFIVTKASVTAFSSTSGWSLSRRKCHKSKSRTGQGFPYRYNYQSFESSAKAHTAVKGKEIIVTNLKKAIQSAKDSLSEKVPFYCGRDHAIALEASIKREDGEVLKSYVSLGLDDERLYAEKPYGRVYLDNSELDLVPTIGQ